MSPLGQQLFNNEVARMREDARIAPIVKKMREEMKRKPKPDFRTYVYVQNPEGEEYEIEVGICYDATYQSEYISGPPEDCYPAYSEMDFTDLIVDQDLPEGITLEMVKQAAADDERIEEEAWTHYFDKGRDE